MTYLQIAAHLFLLLFWTRLWAKPGQSFSFNPFLSEITRFSDKVVGFLRPALMLPDRLTALALLVFAWAFQAMFFVRFGKAWHLSFGMLGLVPPGETLPWGIQFALAGLSSAHFLFQAWTLYFFSRLIAPPVSNENRAQEAFTFLMYPFSRLPLLLQPLVLLVLYGTLVFAALHAGALLQSGEVTLQQFKSATPVNLFTGAPASILILKIGVLAMMSFVGGLETLIYTIIFFILGGLAMMLVGSQRLTIIFRESTDVLLGRFARNPAATGGGLDFTPMIFIIVLSFISVQLQLILCKLFFMPLPL